MAKVIFNYKGLDTMIHCGIKEKIKNIFQKFIINNSLEKTEINFSYNENNINEELTFEQIANTKDKKRKTMNILVKNVIEDNINNIIENNEIVNSHQNIKDINKNASDKEILNNIPSNSKDIEIKISNETVGESFSGENIEKTISNKDKVVEDIVSDKDIEIKTSDNNNEINISNKNNENNNNNTLDKIENIGNSTFYKGIKIIPNKNNNNPNLKYKLDIINTNDTYGVNDIFEVFISLKDKKQYIVSPNINYNLDILNLLDNKIILSLEGHENRITTVRYFINNKDNKEYLISADKNKIVIIWDITNNYDIKFKIETGYKKYIYSCLLLFPNKENNIKDEVDDGYIITSTDSINDDNSCSATKIYSFNNGTLVRYIHNSNTYKVWYLLYWYNKNDNKYYIIELVNKKIVINDLLENEVYCELIQEPEHHHYSGFIYNRDDIDYLCSSSQNGLINIWDLYNKKIFKIINTNKCQLFHIIEWDNKYVIVVDSCNISFKIIDMQIYKVISEIKGQHNENAISVKKICHPIYGNSLLSVAIDKTIKLWIK